VDEVLAKNDNEEGIGGRFLFKGMRGSISVPEANRLTDGTLLFDGKAIVCRREIGNPSLLRSPSELRASMQKEIARKTTARKKRKLRKGKGYPRESG